MNGWNVSFYELQPMFVDIAMYICIENKSTTCRKKEKEIIDEKLQILHVFQPQKVNSLLQFLKVFLYTFRTIDIYSMPPSFTLTTFITSDEVIFFICIHSCYAMW